MSERRAAALRYELAALFTVAALAVTWLIKNCSG